MKLIEAYEILRTPADGKPELPVFLACGFNPLHLSTFLAAHLRLAKPDRNPAIKSGLYGDFGGNVEQLARSTCEVGVVVLEWADLDARLGLRSLGGWTPDLFPDIMTNVKLRCRHLQQALARASRNTTVVLCLPTLPLVPISFAPGWETSSIELELKAALTQMSAELVGTSTIKIVNEQHLDVASPAGERLDVESEIKAGFPYSLKHAANLGKIISQLVSPPAAKKGLITDLDETVWSGIVGEVGCSGVSWDLDHGSQIHGVYQQLLQALSATGVLIAVVSKNDPTVVEKVFERDDMILSRNAVYPMAAGWGPKSQSISRILKAWNIGADSVVFIDDSAIELAEAKANHPGLDCIQFPDSNRQRFELLQVLRNLFGKSAILEEDALRLRSLARPSFAADGEDDPSVSMSHFLETAESELTLSFDKDSRDVRPLELVNKTNQFNLNGRRYSSSEWARYLKDPDVFLMVVGYRDKYGRLGRISVIGGRQHTNKIYVDIWVMSCRAFSREIEHRCVQELFDRFGADEIILDYQPTERNQPFRSFIERVSGKHPSNGWSIYKADFLARQRRSFHVVRELAPIV